MRYASLFLTPVFAISAAAQTHSLFEWSPIFAVGLPGSDKKSEELRVQLVKLVPRLNQYRSIPYSDEQKLLDKMLPNRIEIERLTNADPELKKRLRKELEEQLWRLYLGWQVKSVGGIDQRVIVDKFIPQ